MSATITHQPCDTDPAEIPAEPAWCAGTRSHTLVDGTATIRAEVVRSANGAPYVKVWINFAGGGDFFLALSTAAQDNLAAALSAALAREAGAS